MNSVPFLYYASHCFFEKKIFIIFVMCINMSLVTVSPVFVGAHGVQKKVLEPLEENLNLVISHVAHMP